MERCRKGEGGGFTQVRAMVSLVCPCCPWFTLAPKVFQLCTNHLVWVVCRPVWVNESCQLFLVSSRSSNTPLYPSKCYELRSMPWLLPLPLSCTWTHFLSPSRSWECVMGDYLNCTFVELQLAFYKWFRTIQNDEQVYIWLKNMKHEKNERVEVYYEKLLKLTNSFQHKTTYSFLTIIFRFGLQPYLHLATIKNNFGLWRRKF
jgi:hypothetical protein